MLYCGLHDPLFKNLFVTCSSLRVGRLRRSDQDSVLMMLRGFEKWFNCLKVKMKGCLATRRVFSIINSRVKARKRGKSRVNIIAYDTRRHARGLKCTEMLCRAAGAIAEYPASLATRRSRLRVYVATPS